MLAKTGKSHLLKSRHHHHILCQHRCRCLRQSQLQDISRHRHRYLHQFQLQDISRHLHRCLRQFQLQDTSRHQCLRRLRSTTLMAATADMAVTVSQASRQEFRAVTSAQEAIPTAKNEMDLESTTRKARLASASSTAARKARKTRRRKRSTQAVAVHQVPALATS